MSKIIIGILIYPCISGMAADPANRMTDVQMCANTVFVHERVVITQIAYAQSQHNYFRLRKMVAKPVVVNVR